MSGIEGDDDWQPELAAPEIDICDDGRESLEGIRGEEVLCLDPEEYATLKKRDADLDRQIEATRHMPPAQRNAHITAWRLLHTTCVGARDVDGSDMPVLPPEASHDPAPKPSTGFAVTSKPRRMTKADLAKHTRLSKIATEIANLSDVAAKGWLLMEAKGLLGHGEWLPWLTKIKIAPRTAQNYIAGANTVADAA